MNRSTNSLKGLVFFFSLMTVAVLAGALLFKGEVHAARVSRAAASSVAHQEVCMVTDRVFAKPQIPVEFEGKTYYGCCMGCVSRIKSDRSVRYGTDPVTGREVDKATAFIAEGPGGEALYFESEETASAYSPQGRTGQGGAVEKTP